VGRKPAIEPLCHKQKTAPEGGWTESLSIYFGRLRPRSTNVKAKLYYVSASPTRWLQIRIRHKILIRKAYINSTRLSAQSSNSI
jgi:hypothetical protein